MRVSPLLRIRDGDTQISNTELFFDLVYVVAITQLSSVMREHPSWYGALQALVLLGMIWNVWVYTAWVTNWLDPAQRPTRLMLLGTMAVGLVLAAGVAQAYDHRGLWVGLAYATMQVGRSAYTVWATRANSPLRLNYLRILCWCALSGTLAILGALTEDPGTRLQLFAAAVVVDVVGGIVQFWTPGLGRTDTREWTIDGPHFAERCQAFVLIALGESLVGVGAPLIDAGYLSSDGVIGLIGAFVGVASLFWIYFDRWAEEGTTAIAVSPDPGRLAARAFHLVHPVLIAGIIVIAAGNEEILAPHLGHGAHAAVSNAPIWFCAGGAALFLIGHTIYNWLISRVASLASMVAAAVLVVLAYTAGAFDVPGLPSDSRQH